jgi:hypothetical protein
MRLTAVTIACVLLSGCGRANAAAIDPTDDIHCSVLAFYFHGFAEHHGFPAKQQKAAKGVHDWYAAKMRLVAKERWGGMAGFEKEAGPLLETVKADPLAMRDEMVACTKRAAADPAFNEHARAYR